LSEPGIAAGITCAHLPRQKIMDRGRTCFCDGHHDLALCRRRSPAQPGYRIVRNAAACRESV